MRKRKRNWPIMVYKYRAYVDELPEFIWQHCRTQNKLWNSLVELLKATLVAWEELKEAGPDKDTTAGFWEKFWEECRDVTEASDLGWEAKADILDRFRASVQAAFKNRDREMPKFHSGIGQVRLTHRYTGGGLPAENIFRSRASRFSILQSPPPDAYTGESRQNRRKRVVRARFGLDGETFDFRLRLHRPLPPGAILKNIAWLGEYRYHLDPAKRWRWYIAMWLEIPPENHSQMVGPGAGLDLGWRKFDDYIRVGYLVDSDRRRIELRLSLDTSNYRTRRDRLPATWDDKFELDEEIGRLVEDVKTEIEPLLASINLPEELKRSVGQLAKMRQGGLVRLYQNLRDLDNEDARQVTEILEAWQQQNNRLRRQLVQLTRRLVGRRRWIYGNIAAWLSREYQVVIWEGELDIKAMAEDGDKDASLRRADRYRQIAAIGELRQAIKSAFGKNGASLIAGKTAGTTSICSVCGGLIEVSPALKLLCENGHLLDTDENAARNLLSQIPQTIRAKDDLRENEACEVRVPQEMVGVAVIVHPG